VIAAALMLIASALAVTLVPVGFVVWSPGSTHDLLASTKVAAVDSDAAPVERTGKLLLTTVAVTAPESQLTWPETVVAYFSPDREVLPREVVYQPGATAEDIVEGEADSMASSKTAATVAGVRAAGIDVTQLPEVATVSDSGPAAGVLQRGDLIVKVNQQSVNFSSQVRAIYQQGKVGTTYTFSILRDSAPLEKQVTTRSTNEDPDIPIVGFTMTVGYTYQPHPEFDFGVDPAIGGSSAGLAFALTVADLIGPQDLLDGRVVAATGVIDAEGKVGSVGGVREKLIAAKRDGAAALLFPRDNCADIVPDPAVQEIPVETLDQAIQVLTGAAAAPSCQ
jgi:PDZ domain-containing protein